MIGSVSLLALIYVDDIRQRRLYVLAVFLSSVVLIFHFSPLGRVIRLWYMD